MQNEDARNKNRFTTGLLRPEFWTNKNGRAFNIFSARGNQALLSGYENECTYLGLKLIPNTKFCCQSVQLSEKVMHALYKIPTGLHFSWLDNQLKLFLVLLCMCFAYAKWKLSLPTALSPQPDTNTVFNPVPPLQSGVRSDKNVNLDF